MSQRRGDGRGPRFAEAGVEIAVRKEAGEDEAAFFHRGVGFVADHHLVVSLDGEDRRRPPHRREGVVGDPAATETGVEMAVAPETGDDEAFTGDRGDDRLAVGPDRQSAVVVLVLGDFELGGAEDRVTGAVALVAGELQRHRPAEFGRPTVGHARRQDEDLAFGPDRHRRVSVGDVGVAADETGLAEGRVDFAWHRQRSRRPGRECRRNHGPPEDQAEAPHAQDRRPTMRSITSSPEQPRRHCGAPSTTTRPRESSAIASG